jgi:hypothetical protein
VNIKPKPAIKATVKDELDIESDPVWWEDAVNEASKYDDPVLPSINGKPFCVRLDIRLIIISPIGPPQKCR